MTSLDSNTFLFAGCFGPSDIATCFLFLRFSMELELASGLVMVSGTVADDTLDEDDGGCSLESRLG